MKTVSLISNRLRLYFWVSDTLPVSRDDVTPRLILCGIQAQTHRRMKKPDVPKSDGRPRAEFRMGFLEHQSNSAQAQG